MAERELIRRSRPEDVPQLGTLFREAFGKDRPPEVWQWKYFGERESAGYVCEVEGRIVSHCGGVPVRFRDFSRELLALQSVDFMSSPSYPGGLGGGGVFVRTVRRMFEECCGPSRAQLVYGFPGERHRVVGEKLLGYQPLEPVHEMSVEPSGLDAKPESLTEESLTLFRSQQFPFGAIRDESYLRWRYLQHPVHRYTIVVKEACAALLHDLEDHYLLMEIGGIRDVNEMKRMVAELRALGKPVKAWCSPKHTFGSLFAQSGFRAVARDHMVEYRFFTKRSSLAPGDLYYTAGDYDVF